MAKVNLNKLPVFCSNQSTIFRTLSSIHTYSNRSVSSKSFYVQRTSLVKTNQSLKISGVKIWNSLPGHIRDKVFTSSDKTSSKILKLYLLKFRTYLKAKFFFTCVYIEMNANLFVCVGLILFFPFLFFINFFPNYLNQNKLNLPFSVEQRWSPRGRPWPRGNILKSLALASKP